NIARRRFLVNLAHQGGTTRQDSTQTTIYKITFKHATKNFTLLAFGRLLPYIIFSGNFNKKLLLKHAFKSSGSSFPTLRRELG
ncbi:MAG: hypothetical protein ACKO6C_05690, partial [Alphaproteobacteria bacterium]